MGVKVVSSWHFFKFKYRQDWWQDSACVVSVDLPFSHGHHICRVSI